MQSPYLNVQEAAKYLRCNKEVLRRKCRAKELRYVRFGKNFLFRREWLDRFVEACAQ